MSGGANAVQATFWLIDAPTSFILQSAEQPDGVGLGTFNADGDPVIYRKPVPAHRSQTYISSAQAVRSRTFISHIRHATAGGATFENTHPFEQKGRIFGHNGVIGDLPRLRELLGSYTELVLGSTDSELYFTLITKCIDEAGGDVGAGIAAGARQIAAEVPLYSLNMILTTETEVWALRYPDTNELWILEHSIGGFDAGGSDERSLSGTFAGGSDERSLSGTFAGGFDERSLSGTFRVASAALSVQPATVIASEPMDADREWRPLASGELVHVDGDLRVTSTIAVPDPPAQMIDLTAQEATAQGLGPEASG
jgi:glutamine amidotransferase